MVWVTGDDLAEQPQVLPGALPDLPSLGLFCELREVNPVAAGDFFRLGHHFSVKGQSLGLPGTAHSFSQSCPPRPGHRPQSPGMKEERQADGKW